MDTPTPKPALEVGASATLSKTITEQDVVAFAAISLDDNPVHLDEEYAKTTRFGGRIAHGMLGASLISAVIGTRLPGYGTIYLSQSLAFKGPVRLGDTLTATAIIKAVRPDKPIVTIDTQVHNQKGELVVTGEAVVLAPS